MTAAKQTAKLLAVGPHGVTAHLGGEHRATVSGYVGHDWTDDTDENTVCLDTRPADDAGRVGLAVSGPMPGVDLPPGTVDKVFSGLHPWDEAAGRFGNAGPLDAVALDVFVRLWERVGATVHRGAAAVKFARSVSGPRGWGRIDAGAA